jgi:uncharacterized protein (TIGR01777 family)
MKVIVTGATGFIGSALVQELQKRGDRVVALTRDAGKARQALGGRFEAVEWDPPQPGPWMEAVAGADAVVNLAGEPVAIKAWTAAQKERVMSSRVDATRALVEAIGPADSRPGVLINGSAIGYYGSQGDTILTEDSPPAHDFLASVVVEWEAAARPVEDLGVRLVLLRTGIVLGREGGALPPLVLPFRFFMGGTMGERGQWVSWIHIEDEVGIMLFALDHESVRGPVNATAPNPVTMDVFSRQVGRAIGRPSWAPVWGRAMRIALGERAQVALASQRVVPRALETAGYHFVHADSGEALRSILAE